MTLKKLTLKAGVNKENTRYTTEGGWYDCDKIRFRQGTPEKIGGWSRISTGTFLGVCRSLWKWVTLGGQKLLGIGTNLKFYINSNNSVTYYDVTPLRNPPVSLGNNPFTGSGTTTVTVTDESQSFAASSYVLFSGATAVGGVNLNGSYQVVSVLGSTFTITAASPVTGTGGGSAVVATPILAPNPFSGTGTTTVTVSDPVGGYVVGDYVTFSGATSWVGGTNLNNEYQITSVGAGTYTITAAVPVTGSGGGSAVVAAYQINIGPDVQQPLTGWGTGGWGAGGWGTGTSSPIALRLWSQSNFGQDLVFGPRGGAVYYWDAALGVGSRGVDITSLPGSDGFAPIVQNFVLVTDTNRFVMVFGCNDYGSTTQDAMLIRWGQQESLTMWQPAATNQAGSLRLSRGSEIITALQSRQEILVWTDSSLYSLQYQNADPWWGAQILGDNISIIGQNATSLASGVSYWMGTDKFYKYDGRVQTLRCDLRQFIYDDINLDQNEQVFSGTNEGFNEVWWFYCSENSTVVDRYVVYNYLEDNWYYGNLGRTAWLDSGLSSYPLAATYSYNIVEHENGVDDNATATTLPIEAYIASSEFDIDDGHQVGFIWRMLPDITFRGSSPSITPSVTMYLRPMQNSGSGFNTPESVGGSASYPVSKTGTGTSYNIEEFTGQINTRVRGRQIVMEVRSTGIGVQWQLGSPRMDIRPDGRR